MALLMMDGFDASDAAIKWVNAATAGSSAATRFGYGRAASISNREMYRTITPSNQIIAGAALCISNVDTAIRPYIVLYGDGGSVAHLNVGYSNGQVMLYRGNLGSSPTLLASSPGVFTANSWYYLELSATIADSGGTCTVRLNGVTVINYTGDTKFGGTGTTIDAIGLGSLGGYTAYFDDLYVCDTTGPAPYNTFLGDVRVYSLSPNGAGSSTQFTPSTGANYAAVDELPYSATDYVSSGTPGQRDLYTLTDLPASTGGVLAVQHNLIAKKTDSPIISLKPVIKSGVNTYDGAAKTLGGVDTTLSDLRTTDPATGTSWTATGVNSLEAGFEVV